MLDFIFTVDYEIYGNGTGSLRELIYEPAEKLIDIFSEKRVNIVFFIEVAELEIIEAFRSDPEINLIKNQIKRIYKTNFEIGLHIHPQWYEARLANGQWILNYEEYNLCKLDEDRIYQLLKRAVDHLRYLVDDPGFSPLVYRAGNWLMTPTEKMGRALTRLGIKIDSSLFKGGYQHSTGLDYRQAPKNLFYWKFSENINKPDLAGSLFEIPIYTKMLPIWKVLNGKRFNIEKKAANSGSLTEIFKKRLLDVLNFRFPVKFDLCRLSYNELISFAEELINLDAQSPELYKPIVLIGHTKDNPDFDIITRFLDFLDKKNIKCSSYNETLKKIDIEE